MNTAIFDRYDIPLREATELKNCKRLIDLENNKKKKKDFTKTAGEVKSEPLNELLLKKLENHALDASEEPHINLVYHERLDGAVSSLAFCKQLEKGGHSFVYDPKFKENKLSSYIKPTAIRRVAREEGRWKEKSFFDAGFVFTTILSILSILLNILFGSGIDLFEFKLPLAAVIILAVVAVGLASLSVAFFLAKLKTNRKASLDEFESEIVQWDDSEYISFINKFSAEDYSAFSEDTVVLNFASYGRRARLAIYNYLARLNVKQCWFVFLENRGVLNEELMSVPYASVYSMDKLHFSKKRKLAIEVKTHDGVSFRDECLNSFGVDRIFSALFKNELTEDKKRQIAQRIKDFVADNESNNSNVDIAMLLNFVAELSVKYMVNFENPREWEYLFDYPDRDDEILEFDKGLTRELLFRGADDIKDRHYSQLKKYITDICAEFSSDFESITAYSTELDRLRGYQQLLAVKALRIKNQDEPERLLNIAISITDELYSMDDLDDYTAYSWDKVVLKALSVFERCNFRSFNCSIINRLLTLAGKRRGYSGRVFSDPMILYIARSNLILGPNLFGAAADIEAYNRGIENTDAEPVLIIDTVLDHYRVLKYAHAELKPEDNTGYGKTPISFGLLNMSADERDEYYALLRRMSENDVVEFYENLYDTLCAASQKASAMRYSSYEIYSNDLKSKYGKASEAEEYSVYSGNVKYVAVLLDRMFSLVGRVYKDDDIISSRLDYLHRIFKSGSETGGEIILELADAEFSGLSLLCYLVSMTARVRMDNDAKILENMYLSIGNYIVRLVFLVYHECLVSSFHNTDIQYLVRIMTSYTHPDRVIIGLLSYYERMNMPQHSYQVLLAYLEEHKREFTDGMLELVENLGIDDYQGVIDRIVASSTLSNEEKNELYAVLLERLKGNDHTTVGSVIIELLTLRKDGHQSDAFADLDNSAIAERLCTAGVQSNTRYLILYAYSSIDADRFMPLCVPFYSDLLSSSFVKSEELIVKYLEKYVEDEVYADDYVQMLNKYTSYALFKKHLSQYTWQSSYFKRVFTRIKECLTERRDPAFAEIIERLSGFVPKLADEHRSYIYIEQKERFFAHVWSHGAILRYLKYLIDNSGFGERVYTEYSSKTEEEKRNCVLSNVGSIAPLIKVDNKSYINTEYSDMIDMFLNNTDNIQSHLGEEDCMLGFFADAKTLVEAIFADDSRGKEIAARLAGLESAFKSIN